ncbi:MAG TPA: filamentous hemagglutinin N-terminal domain-containing protein [Candidatus Saccharimonadales bacterium]|nr:filamentous hemagglutinin N-terminal domain-containing protein [Candidatus Saccharimonadales bacterium]
MQLRTATALATALAFCVTQEAAYALPVGGQVEGGAASITTSGSTTTIDQSSSRALINWQGFDVGSGETVSFNQPASSSITLNRVTAGGASQINGNINASGQVWIVNSQGVMFGSGSQVNVGGLLATSSNISDSNFMAGKDLFDAPGSAAASISNAGHIKIADGGLAALVGSNVSNSGVITANLDKVQLGSGNTFALDLYGDGLINLQASPAITSQLIDNSGTIAADGGKVLLTTAAAENALSSLVNLDGIINAGDITIDGVAVSHVGQMDATGKVNITAKNIAQQGDITANSITESFTGDYIDNAAAQTTANNISITGGTSSTLFASGHYTAPGGNISMAAENMWLYAAALDASGNNSGGSIFLGDSNTQNVSVNFYSTLKADAIDSGNGGHIKVWSEKSTSFGAATSARGGATSGNGGLIEISSAGQDYVGGNTPDVSAPHGNAGTFLLDPRNITIADTSTTGGGLAFFPLTNPNPSSSNGYGSQVVALANGNIVVTNPNDSFSASNSGAVYLFNGSSGALISTLRGSQANDKVGPSNSITLLTGNNNFVINNYNWANGAATNAGAATWASGTTGVSGIVSSSNSLVGSLGNDYVGDNGITALTNGNYVVASANWADGAIAAVGAVTWGNGATGITGTISASNSLVGSQANDAVGYGTNGSNGVTALTNGNYVVNSPLWNNGAVSNVGAVTWGDGMTGVSGAVSSSNSLVGSQINDAVGYGGITALTNGNYVVSSYDWANGAATNAGAVTWASGTTGITGAVSAANSLVGTNLNSQVGSNVTALTNGNYVVDSAVWGNGTFLNVGAVTWGDGSGGTTVGAVSSSNSLVGSQGSDIVGSSGVTALPNGNYVVGSYFWNGTVGEVTFGCGSSSNTCGTNGTSGIVSSANSLVGNTVNDKVGYGGITVLTNGNYVVSSYHWANGAASDAGAVTWGNGTTGITGTITAANSLVGSTASDRVGEVVIALTNGNYVVDSYNWANGAATAAGAITWGSGTSGVSGTVSSSNSLVGSQANDKVGRFGSVYALTNGNYVVASPQWANGAVTAAGAVTWGSGTTGVTGTISSSNSLVGSTSGDTIGSAGVTALTNGNYVVSSPIWVNGAVQVGAVTWGNGTTGTTGAVSSSNSLVGSTAGDSVGNNFVKALTNGNYVVISPVWDNGATADAGAATFGSGTSGVTGTISTANSIIGPSASAGLQSIIEDSAEGTFIVPFSTAGAIYVSPSSGLGALASSAFLPNADFTVDAAYIAATLNAGTNVTLQATNNITVADAFTKTAGGDATLTLQADNDISFSNNAVISSISNKLNVVLAATGTGSITMGGGSGIASNGGNITLGASGGHFINNSGAGALSAGSGRWLIYSHDSAGDSYNGLSAAFTLYSCIYSGACGTLGSGNGFLYAIANPFSSALTPTQSLYFTSASQWISDLSSVITADPLNTATQRRDTTPPVLLDFAEALLSPRYSAISYYIYNPYGNGIGVMHTSFGCDSEDCSTKE